MTYTVIIRPRASTDIARAARWYEDQHDNLGVEFVGVIQDSLNRVAIMPLAFQCIRRRPDVRRVLTKRFPYRIFFMLRPNSVVVILRVLHNAQDEPNWETVALS